MSLMVLIIIIVLLIPLFRSVFPLHIALFVLVVIVLSLANAAVEPPRANARVKELTTTFF